MKFIDLKDKILTSNFFLFAIILLLIVAILGVVNASYKRRLVDEQIKMLAEQMKKIDNDNQNFNQEIERYQTPEFLEKEARRRFNLKKDGESVIIVPNNLR